MVEWTDDCVFKIIEFYEANEALYDKSSKDYRNRTLKTNLEQEIARHLAKSRTYICCFHCK